MNSVKIKRTELLKKIKANRDIHEAEYKEAYVGYKAAVIEGLQKLLENAKSGKELRTGISLPVPHSYTQEYDRVIAMLEMSVDKVVELEAQDFNRYVLDNWEWKEMSKTIFANYSSTIK